VDYPEKLGTTRTVYVMRKMEFPHKLPNTIDALRVNRYTHHIFPKTEGLLNALEELKWKAPVVFNSRRWVLKFATNT